MASERSGTPSDRPPAIPAEVLAYYARGREVGRLQAGHALLERAPTEEPRATIFTTAFFHHPAELAAEGGRPLLWAARAVERGPSLLGFSAHPMAVARRA